MTATFVHRFVPGDPSRPVILALHGTGGDENDLLPLARMIEPHGAILSPRGRVLENGMPRFFKRLAEGVFDQDDLREQTEALAHFIATAAQQYGFDPSQVHALGYSNGANIAASVMLAYPKSLAGGMLLRAMIPFEPAQPPDLSHARVLLSAGRQDTMIPQALTTRLAEMLKTSGADVTLLWQSGGHGLTAAEVSEVGGWWKS
jgi:phospholipase/carboxylesterase